MIELVIVCLLAICEKKYTPPWMNKESSMEDYCIQSWAEV